MPVKALALLCATVVLLEGCDGFHGSATYTLYRNSPLDPSLRVHWATFDAADKGTGAGDYNQANCSMAAELLNANVAKLNAGQHPARFWCEKGRFKV